MSGTTDAHSSTREDPRVETRFGHHPTVDPSAIVGYAYADDAGPTVVGDDARIRAHTIVYGDVTVGDGLTTGHRALIREHTTLGDDVLVGTGVVVDGTVDIGSHVSLQSGVYVPPASVIADHVFAGPGAVLTNDPHPLRADVELAGPTLERGVSVGANATILPDVTIGERSFVAAGAVVTRDVPPDTLAVGTPATHRDLPDVLEGGNASP